MRSPTSKPVGGGKQHILAWAEAQMQQGVPRQLLCELLLRADRSNMTLAEMHAFAAAESELFGVVVDRNLRGIALEREGRTDEAIALYEANLADQFIGTHPYERLRIIYTKRHDYQNAIRVCQAYLALPQRDPKKKARFQTRLNELRAKAS